MNKQEQAISKVIRLRSAAKDAQHNVDKAVYAAVAKHGVTVGELADQLSLSRARVYQMLHAGKPQE